MPTPDDDLYRTLGVGRDASQEEIAAAGRKAVKRTHPDAGGSEEAFDKVSKALTVLKDPAKRANYDRTGSTASPSESTEHAAALEILALALTHQLGGPNVSPEFTDVVAGMKAAIKRVIENQRAQIPPVHQAQARLAKFRKRLKMKGQETAGHLEAVMAGQDRGFEQSLASMQQVITRHEAALAMVEEYVYQVDERPAPSYAQGGEWRTIGNVLSDEIRRQGLNRSRFGSLFED